MNIIREVESFALFVAPLLWRHDDEFFTLKQALKDILFHFETQVPFECIKRTLKHSIPVSLTSPILTSVDYKAEPVCHHVDDRGVSSQNRIAQLRPC